MLFEILYIGNSDRISKFVFARSINENIDFSLTDKSTLGGVPIKPIISQPKTSNKNGNSTFDVFAFHLKTKSDMDLLKVGQLVELIP
ncbi:MAG: hypothetical protein J7604_24665 [Sporocytophaga sp.]|uniref:hypothetical protein n=1 Tax=Sporocytophaga sp. TaxID=2231183 RepID=UPI001B1B2B74|nr:hypothetical protein [Sporocytophaga sp.]MBO9703425.1 hypothetical protein [Sporocytophaga sp.]